jgi:hypothetical protein
VAFYEGPPFKFKGLRSVRWVCQLDYYILAEIKLVKKATDPMIGFAFKF